MIVAARQDALAMPIPEDCSDSYASGWAVADAHVSKGGNLDADAPAGWSEEARVNGFWDRLTAEREKRAAEIA